MSICDECGGKVEDLVECVMCGWRLCDVCSEDHDIACDEAEKEEEKSNG